MKQTPVYILAGGRSSRFGSDKARAELNGQPLMTRLADVAESMALPVTVVADRVGKYADLGMPTIVDERPGLGPLGGLATALADRRERWGAGWLLLISCDLVDLRSAWVEALVEQKVSSRGAVAFRGQTWQPMPALYHTVALPRVRTHLKRNELAMRRMLDALDATALPLPPDWPEIPQVNSQEELAAFRRAMDKPK